MNLYESLGGIDALRNLTANFYAKMLQDEEIAHFFEGFDIEDQKEKMATFLGMAFGGTDEYKGRDMREAHKGLVKRGLNERHFDLVINHLGDTLVGAGVDMKLIEEVLNIARSTKQEVLNM